MPLAVSKDVQDELLAIRADLEAAMLKFIRDRHYGAAERMLVIVDRGLHNLIRDAAIVAHASDEPITEGITVSAQVLGTDPAAAPDAARDLSVVVEHTSLGLRSGQALRSG